MLTSFAKMNVNIGIEMIIFDWSKIKAGDDAAEAKLFPLKPPPHLAFSSHENIVEMYHKKKLL